MTDAIRALRLAVEAGTWGADGIAAHPPELGAASFIAWSAYNGSFDAALVFMKAVLPEWAWWVDGHNGASVWYAWVEGDAPYFDGEYGPNVDTPARALLLAVLKALEATASASQSPAHLGDQEDSQ
jgi:hypothetical protein